MTNPYEIMLSEITKPSAATQWVTSDHVTMLLDKWRKERFERMECACGEIVSEADAEQCISFDEYICKGCR